MTGPLILNRYRALETRGKGGFSRVDVAWDTRLQRRVALKRIPLNINESDLPGIQEARTAALLNDPHIVNVHDFEVTGTEALLIMEYVEGPTLGALLAESIELLDFDIIATIAHDVAQALEFAHENQVLHLDIKPDNILIDHSGHCKVLDFGLSQLSCTAGFTEPEGGTIGYMPPEQLAMGEVDERSDEWAFAILIYLLLTGKNPFFAESAAASALLLQNAEIVLPSALCPDLDERIDEVLLLALASKRERRFASVELFASELLPCLGNPQRGRKKLKARVNEQLAELGSSEFYGDTDGARNASKARNADERDDPSADTSTSSNTSADEKLPLFARLSERTHITCGRLVAAVACGFTAFLGLSGFGLLSAVARYEANTYFILLAFLTLFIALAAFLSPELGSILGLLALGAGIIAQGFALVGGVLLLLSLVWWVFCGRRGRAEATVSLLAPLLGVLWIPFALPLLAGYFLSAKRAFITALWQGILFFYVLVPLTTAPPATSTLASSAATITPLHYTHSGLVMPPFGGADWSWYALPFNMQTALTELGLLVAIVLWAGAAAGIALLAQRRTSSSLLLGTVLGCALFSLPFLAFPLLQLPYLSVSLPNPGALAYCVVTLALSFILIALLVRLGVPTGAESRMQALAQQEEG